MIFFAEETTPKPGDPQGGAAETEAAAPPGEPRPESAPEAASAGQPALFAPAEPVPGGEPAVAAGAAGEAAPVAPEIAAAPAGDPPVTVKKPSAGRKGAPARKGKRPPVALSEVREDRAVIKVIGVGGGGGNAVNRMIEAGVTGVEFIAANTDAQVLELSQAPVKIQLGGERTGGLGCGGDPEVGRLAARDDINRLIEVLAGADMVFITVGEGGGTGTGAAPVIACVAQEIRALCVAVATKPMSVEGRQRRTTANDGIRELREYVDTLICVPNDRVVEVYGNLKIREAFQAADDVVRQAVQGISDLIQVPGEINLDFADVRAAMRLRGDAVMGIGVAAGEARVEDATRAAISSPLLEDTSIQGATSIIVNVTGGESLTLNEVQHAVEVVRDAVAPDGAGYYGSTETEPGDNILIGTALDPTMDEIGEIKVTVVATGFPDRSRAGATPHDFARYTDRATGTHGVRSAAPGVGGTAPVAQGPNGGRVGSSSAVALPSAEAREAAALASGGPEEAGMPLPEDLGDERWGDLETPPYLHRRR